MAWSFIHMYLTHSDTAVIRDFVNESVDVSWVEKLAECGHDYTWRTVPKLQQPTQLNYVLWHRACGPVNVPSGTSRTPDDIVADPDAGWNQRLDGPSLETPWFGSNPAPIFLHLAAEVRGKTLHRSDFSWAGDHFKLIGKAVAPEAKSWWKALRQHIGSCSEAILWPPGSTSRRLAFVFPDAARLVASGVALDPNP